MTLAKRLTVAVIDFDSADAALSKTTGLAVKEARAQKAKASKEGDGRAPDL